MSNNRIDSLAVTQTIGRQTPRNEFGEVMKNTLKSAGSVMSGALVGASAGGLPVVSAAISSVTSLAGQAPRTASVGAAATGVTTVGGAGVTVGSTVAGGLTPGASGTAEGFQGMLDQMRTEADKSTLQQMQMQQESRDYNMVSNVLKVRHDSAKAAINNIR
jgi:hypothetical protein